ncbi:hypothetical protein GSS88_09995 [Corynebacterium sp. 3HC-13]|uniref:hypothetical protein n=1 Tax=Corynebacterium poyangense TaxID=2684405 RepID=UPI001CC9DDCE|nr:hypothetical protein [Corynebacterium poyangense]MBZ8178112.1 hypothetical protein [Corynebacterium poyangense]
MLRPFSLSLAGVFSAYLIGGIIWGLVLRLPLHGTREADGIAIHSTVGSSPEFLGFLGFTGLSILIAGVVTFITFSRARPSLALMCWLVVLTFLGGYIFVLAGDFFGHLRYPLGDFNSIPEGEDVLLLPAASPGLGAHLGAPFIAALSYWSGLLLEPAPRSLPSAHS